MNHYIIYRRPNGTYLVDYRPATRTIPAHDGVPETIIELPAPRVGGMAKILTLNHEPSLDEQKQAFGDDDLSKAKAAKAKALYVSAKAALLAIFNQLPPGVRAQFQSVFNAADLAAQAGGFQLAQDIISTCVVPDALATTQAALVTAIGPYVTLAASLAAATTIEQVNAVSIP